MEIKISLTTDQIKQICELLLHTANCYTVERQQDEVMNIRKIFTKALRDYESQRRQDQM